MNKHTPTPWKAVDIRSTERNKRGVVYYQIKQANGAKSSIGFAGVYEGKNPDAGAAYIVTACNSHDDLIAALTALENAATAANTIIQNQRPDGQIAHDLEKAITSARAAIAKAENWTAEDILRQEG